jgi:hypothetical protein
MTKTTTTTTTTSRLATDIRDSLAEALALAADQRTKAVDHKVRPVGTVHQIYKGAG